MPRVRITCSQMVHYGKTVSMTAKEWKEIKSLHPKEVAGQLIGGWIDPGDVETADDVEADNFYMIVVNAKGEVVKPVDQYEN